MLASARSCVPRISIACDSDTEGCGTAVTPVAVRGINRAGRDRQWRVAQGEPGHFLRAACNLDRSQHCDLQGQPVGFEARRSFYRPGGEGAEARIAERLDRWAKLRAAKAKGE